MSEEITYSFVVRDVSVTMDENTIKSDLMKRYDGVAEMTRMFFDDKEETPKTSVQVDFTLATDVKKIIRDGNIVIGGICRQAYAIKKPAYQRANQKPHQNWQNTTKPLWEQDLVNMFEEQKKLLTDVLTSLEDKLNNSITLRQGNTAQLVLSSNT